MTRILYALLLASIALAQNPNTAVFPARAATDGDLMVATDNARTTLAVAVNSSATGIVLSSATNFTTPLVMTIDNEQLRCPSHTGTTYTCTRGWAGSTAAAHAFLAIVHGNVTAYPINQLAAETKAVEGYLHNGLYVFQAGVNGAACDSSTDDTAAFNALLANAAVSSIFVYSGFGNTCRIAGQLTIPNTGGSLPAQRSIQILGLGPTANGYWLTPLPSASTLDLRYSGANAKILTLGSGTLKFSGVTWTDGGNDATAFLLTTNTTVEADDMEVSGTGQGQDVFVFGGNPGSTCSGVGSAVTSCFQGYHSHVNHVFFDRIQRAVWLANASYTNNVWVTGNTVTLTCGSTAKNGTQATDCTNANPTVCTFNAILNVPSVPITLSGATGNWTPLNATMVATYVSPTQASLPIDATGFGAFTGTVMMNDGAAFEVWGDGNHIDDNLIEVTNYPYGIEFFNGATSNQDTGNSCWDGHLPPSIHCVRTNASATYNHTSVNVGGGSAPYVNGESGASTGQITNTFRSQTGQQISQVLPMAIANNKCYYSFGSTGSNTCLIYLDTSNLSHLNQPVVFDSYAVLGNNQPLQSYNAAGNARQSLIYQDASNNVQIAGNSQNTWLNGTVNFGSWAILPNNTSLYSENAAGNARNSLIYQDASNNVQIAGSSQGTWLNGIVNFGAWAILPNNAALYSENAAGSAINNMVYQDTSNRVHIAASSQPVLFDGVATGTKGPLCISATGLLSVGNNSGSGAPCP